MHNRNTLHKELVNILGSKYVYFQPPETLQMKYPCIVYERYDISNTHADDLVYIQPRQYRVTVIDTNPDSDIVTRMSQFPTATMFCYMAVHGNLDYLHLLYKE